MDRIAVVERGDDLLVDRVEFDEASQCLRTGRVTVRSDNVTRTRVSWRLYSEEEFCQAMQRSGFATCSVFGDGGAPFDRSSSRMLVIGKKA